MIGLCQRQIRSSGSSVVACRGITTGKASVASQKNPLWVAAAVRNALVWILVCGPIAAKAQESPAVYAPTAQTPVYTISGVVLDPSEAVIVGARVTLSGRELDHPNSTTTGPAGDFRFSGVPAGKYHIEVEQDGFDVSQVRVKVGTRPPAPLRIVLAIATVREEMTIRTSEGGVSAEPGENADMMRLRRESLDSLPILGNNVLAAVLDLLDPASVGLRPPTLVVDGLVTSEIGVPASAIQEINVNQNPYSAEFSSPGQARIHITTKTGSQQYHGSLNGEFRDFRLDARNAFAVRNPPERHRVLDAYFSGPLAHSTNTSFMVSTSREENDLQSIINALVPSGAVHGDFPDSQTSTYVSAGITRKMRDGGGLSLRYSYLNRSEEGIGVGGLTLPEAASDKTVERHHLYISDKVLITTNLVNELSARISTSNSTTKSQQQGEPAIIVGGTFTGGGAQQAKRETLTALQLGDTISWSHGKHLIKAGLNVPALERHALVDQTNFGGTFQFDTLDHYEQGKPLSFVQQSGNPRVVFWYTELGAFIQDDIRVRPGLSLSLGLRYEWQNYVPNYNNFAPRFAFAFAPGKDKKTVFRGGAGIFYQNTDASAIADKLRLNGQLQHQIVISNPDYPDPFTGEPIGQVPPSSIVRFAPDLRLPYIVQYSAGIERQLQKSTIFTATYIGTKGTDLFRSRDINAPQCMSPPLPAPQFPPVCGPRPISNIATLREIESNGRSESNALKLALRGNIRSYFNGMVQYTLSRSYDNTSGLDFFPANQYDLTGEWGRSDFDSLHYLSFFGSLDAAKLFRLGLKLNVRSGRPYTITTGSDDYRTTFLNARPDGVPRNSMQGPGLVGLDLRVAKDFSLRQRKERKEKNEGLSATVALDAFNLLNHVNLGPRVGNEKSSFFGQSVGAGPARRLQLSMAVKF